MDTMLKKLNEMKILINRHRRHLNKKYNTNFKMIPLMRGHNIKYGTYYYTPRNYAGSLQHYIRQFDTRVRHNQTMYNINFEPKLVLKNINGEPTITYTTLDVDNDKDFDSLIEFDFLHNFVPNIKIKYINYDKSYIKTFKTSTQKNYKYPEWYEVPNIYEYDMINRKIINGVYYIQDGLLVLQ